MKKILEKPFFYPLIVALMMIVSLSAHNSFWPSNQSLDTEDKMNCLRFQNLRGSNRIAEAELMWQTLFSTSISKKGHKVVTTSQFSFFDIEKIMGNPDLITTNGDLVYFLNTSYFNCKIIIKNNNNQNTITCFLDDCK